MMPSYIHQEAVLGSIIASYSQIERNITLKGVSEECQDLSVVKMVPEPPSGEIEVSFPHTTPSRLAQ